MAGSDVQRADDADALWLPSSYGESVEQVGDHCWCYGYWISYYYRIQCADFKKKRGREPESTKVYWTYGVHIPWMHQSSRW